MTAQPSDPDQPRLPLVSVVTPTYNQPELLRETLAAVFQQSYEHFEVVVVDDGSTDDTPHVLQRLQEEHGQRLRVIRQENKGIGAARNRGIDEARGEFIALLDHDDLWMPTKLEVQVRFMQSHPDCVACSVPWAELPRPNRCVFDLEAIGADRIVERPLRALALHGVFIISSALMFRRDKATGLRYETHRRCLEDTPFQLGLFARGEFGVAGSAIQMLYRIHRNNYSSSADYSYNGWKLLLGKWRAGEFAGFQGVQMEDLRRFMAGIARWASMSQAMAGLRWRALCVYFRHLHDQIRFGRFRFVVILPALLLLPTAYVVRRFHSRQSGVAERSSEATPVVT